MMKTKEIRDLIEFIAQTGLDEVNIETEELKLEVKKSAGVTTIAAPAVAAPVVAAAPAPAPVAAAPAAEAPVVSDNSTSSHNYLEVKSPMIGTFYTSPNPESPAFVKEGDQIKAGQTICIIEAMKLFNEIDSEVSGKVVKIMVDNASPVEFDQVLFLVDPS